MNQIETFKVCENDGTKLLMDDSPCHECGESDFLPVHICRCGEQVVNIDDLCPVCFSE